MKRLPMPRRVWLVLVPVLLVLALLIAWWLRRPVGEYILPPVAGWLWRLRNLGRMVPQEEVWAGLVILGAVNALFFLFRWVKVKPVRPLLPPRSGRVGYWLEALRVGRRARRLVIRPLRYLVVQIVAHGEHRSRDVVQAQLQNETLPLPPHLQAYLNDRRTRQPPTRGRDTGVPPSAAYEPELEEIVRILEDYLEVPHES